MVIWTLARKDLRLLVRDARALIILLAMPLIFITILGVSLGEGFGQKPADRLRVSVLNLDKGLPANFHREALLREAAGWVGLSGMPRPGAGGNVAFLEGWSVAASAHTQVFPPDSWSAMILRDLAETAEIQVELIPSEEEADRLVKSGRRAAILVLGPHFSKRVQRCSFLAAGWREAFMLSVCYPQAGQPVQLAAAGLFQEDQDLVPLYLMDGINPFYRDGVRKDVLDVRVEKDPTQLTAAAIIEQVAQGSLLRIVLPWMIGRAFEKVGDPEFLTLLGKEKEMPPAVSLFLNSPFVSMEQKRTLGLSLKAALQNLFPRYHLTAKTWASLTRESEHVGDGSGKMKKFREDGQGWLKRGAARYQLLVPSALVMFAFFLVLTTGWLFVAERRQGTMLRLRSAPLTRGQILTGKLLPCLAMSLFQGFFLLVCGKLIFNMSWGPAPAWLALVVASTSFAAMGLALLVASLARTETQVAVYGTLLVIILAMVSGALIGDRSLMPDNVRQISLFTPNAWALEAYRQLLANSGPVDYLAVARDCGVLGLFGLGFVAISWWLLRLD